jgi:hypothetical protein
MSEFVLKLAGWDHNAPVVWLPGVTKVQRMDTASWGSVMPTSEPTAGVRGVFDDYEPDYQFMSNTIGKDAVVTLLWIETGSYGGYACVEQAWLVGPGGGTVDRLSGT